jgi:hypothetical protein
MGKSQRNQEKNVTRRPQADRCRPEGTLGRMEGQKSKSRPLGSLGSQKHADGGVGSL